MASSRQLATASMLPCEGYFRAAVCRAGPAVGGDAFGTVYLCQPALADMVAEAMHYNAGALGHYVLHAFVVMPNHVHLLLTPAVDVPKLTKSLKGITAKRANLSLGLTGHPFWQEESYDHLVRNGREFERIRLYMENNPVRVGLIKEAIAYRWSSAGWQPGGCHADGGVRPTTPQDL